MKFCHLPQKVHLYHIYYGAFISHLNIYLKKCIFHLPQKVHLFCHLPQKVTKTLTIKSQKKNYIHQNDQITVLLLC